MKIVQDALKDIGIPVCAGLWKPTEDNQRTPDAYVVYSTTSAPLARYDDGIHSFKTYVYMSLWSSKDPTEIINTIRLKMFAAGFGMVAESDKGYNQTAYDYKTQLYNMHWTWVIGQGVDYGL